MSKRKIFIGVVGNRKAGKSTVIQSLTGCPSKSGVHDVDDYLTGERLLVIASSPQEDGNSNRQFRPRMRKAAKDPRVVAAVVAIRPPLGKSHTRVNLRHMTDFARKLNFDVQLFVLDPPRHQSNPINLSGLHTHLAQNTPVTVLNAGKFAHLNARAIRRKTKAF